MLWEKGWGLVDVTMWPLSPPAVGSLQPLGHLTDSPELQQPGQPQQSLGGMAWGGSAILLC